MSEPNAEEPRDAESPAAEPRATEPRGSEDRDPLAALLPKDFDLMELVREYPIPAVLLAALGGYALGRSKGDWVLGALSTFAAAQLTRQVSQLLGDQLSDFASDEP